MTSVIEKASKAAIGGLGGSGTRAAAQLVQDLGYYMGSDLNDALDNLWFTLLFKRRSALVESLSDFRRLIGIFYAAMQGDKQAVLAAGEAIARLARQGRIQHDAPWLQDRAGSMLDAEPFGSKWGWKEPNTHIFIDRFLEEDAGLKYVHISRHPVYMMSSGNMNQLENWGPVFFDGPVEKTPQAALAYSRVVHQRMLRIKAAWPDRVMMLRYEDIVRQPQPSMRQVAAFLCTEASEDMLQGFADYVAPYASSAAPPRIDRSLFAPGDLDYIEAYWST